MYCTSYIHFSVPTDTGYRSYQTMPSPADSSVCLPYNPSANWLFNCMNNRKFKASDNSLCVGILWVPQRTFQQYAKNARSEKPEASTSWTSTAAKGGGKRGTSSPSPSPSSPVPALAERGDVTCDKNLPRLPATSAASAAAAADAAVVATLCCLMPGFKNDECANVSGLQQERKKRQMRHMRQPAACCQRCLNLSWTTLGQTSCQCCHSVWWKFCGRQVESIFGLLGNTWCNIRMQLIVVLQLYQRYKTFSSVTRWSGERVCQAEHA